MMSRHPKYNSWPWIVPPEDDPERGLGWGTKLTSRCTIGCHWCGRWNYWFFTSLRIPSFSSSLSRVCECEYMRTAVPRAGAVVTKPSNSKEEKWLGDLPRPVQHEALSAEDDQHVDAAVVEHVGPVPDHPFSGVLVDEVVLKIKNVRVIRNNFDIHFSLFFALLLVFFFLSRPNFKNLRNSFSFLVFAPTWTFSFLLCFCFEVTKFRFTFANTKKKTSNLRKVSSGIDSFVARVWIFLRRESSRFSTTFSWGRICSPVTNCTEIRVSTLDGRAEFHCGDLGVADQLRSEKYRRQTECG